MVTSGGWLRGLGGVLGCLVVASSVLPVASATAAPARRGDVRLRAPDGIASGEAGPQHEAIVRPDELIRAAGSMRDIDSYVAAEKELLERTWGTSVTSLHASADADAAAAEGASPEREYVPLPSSDLNGDGYEDVLYFDIGRDQNSFMSDVAVRSHDGRNGRQLWTKEFGLPYNLLVLSPGDLTGDDSDDILVVRVDQSWSFSDVPCPQQACVYDDTLNIEWTINLLSGLDGAAVWDRTYDGTIRYTGGYAFPGPLITVARRTVATNAPMDVRPSDDVDGDGERDLVFNLLGYEGEIIFNQKVSWEPLTYATDSVVVSGATGTDVITRSVADKSGPASLVPAGDTSGDGRGDLLWTSPSILESPLVCPLPGDCMKVETGELALEMIDGSSGTPLWDATIAEETMVDGAPVLVGRDLTGDSRSDPIIGVELGGGAERAIALSGSDGARLWDLDTRLTDPPTAVGSLDGGSGSDVLFWEGWYPDDAEAPGVLFRIRLRRVDGVTGTELFLTQHDLPDTQRVGTIYAYALGDADADGRPDIAHALWDYDGSWVPNGTASTVLRVESVVDGHDIVRLERDRKALLFHGGDLVRGGPQDLLEGSTPYNDTNFELSGIEMPTGRSLWHRTDVIFKTLFGALDDRRAGGSDVLYGRTQFTQEAPRWRSRVDVMKGSTGARLWGGGFDMGDPPIPDPVVPTTIDLTPRSTRKVAYSDVATLEARLAATDGAPIAGETVTFRFGNVSEVASTNEDGIATARVRTTHLPGRHPLAVDYEGSAEYGASHALTTIDVVRELTRLLLKRSGSRLIARLHDEGDPLARKPIQFRAGGRFFAVGRTDDRGRLVRRIPKRFRANGTVFVARFRGNDVYRPSGARLRSV